MADIGKIVGIEIASIAKVIGITGAAVMGFTWPSGGPAVPYTTGLLLDLDVADLSLSDTDPVSSWVSKESYTFSQAVGDNQPTFRTNYVDGNNAVRFDGGDILVGTGSLNLKSFFVVCANERAVFTDYYGLFSGTAGGAKALAYNNSPHIWYESGNVTNVYRNNVDINQVPDGLAVFYFVMGANYNETYQIGQDRSLTSRRWLGPVLRIIGYDDVLGTSDKETMFSYLQTEYGIS